MYCLILSAILPDSDSKNTERDSLPLMVETRKLEKLELLLPTASKPRRR